MAPFEGFLHKNVKGANERAEDEAGELSGHHSENLYDQNEDAAGEKFDLATGKPFVNDNELEEIAQHLTPEVVQHGKKDALPDLEEEEDAAARWLRENGG